MTYGESLPMWIRAMSSGVSLALNLVALAAIILWGFESPPYGTFLTAMTPYRFLIGGALIGVSSFFAYHTATNAQVTRDRAFVVFTDLLADGRKLTRASPEQWADWEGRVRHEIAKFLDREAMTHYLMSTGRIDRVQGIAQIREDHYDDALGFIERQLSGKFEWTLTVWPRR